jgi:hypothetical protein
MPEETTDIADVVRGIRRRAAFARVSAFIIIAVLTAIGIGTALIFLQFWSSPTLVIGPGAHLANPQIQVGGGLDWIQELTKAFVRISGVIIAVFLINILVSIARYNMRVANYWTQGQMFLQLHEETLNNLRCCFLRSQLIH